MPHPTPSSLSLPDLLSREWLVTNNLGGYASSTLPGLNTRKYHGLLVAAMAPPVRRMVLLSRVDESVRCADESLPLSCAEYPNAIYPDGYRHLAAFDHHPYPRWAYQTPAWTLQKSLHLLPGQNTVLLTYTLFTADTPTVELELRPLFAIRSIHHLTYQWTGRPDPERLSANHHRIHPTPLTPEVFFAHDRGDFTPDQQWYLNTIHRRETERGYAGLEDLWSPGVVRVTLSPGQSAHFACSTEPIDLPKVVTAPVPDLVTDDPADLLTRAATAHLAPACPVTDFPWSPPSVRDALVAYPGLFLCTKRFVEGERFLHSLIPLLKNGLLPTALPEDASAPECTGADTSLWFIHAVHHYLRYTCPDPAAAAEWLTTASAPGSLSPFQAVESILTAYTTGTDLNIRLDENALLCSHSPGQPTTWMDAKCGPWILTPRAGRPVELNALWYSALRIGSSIATKLHQTARAHEWSTLAARCRVAFNAHFWNDRDGCLFDVVADHGPDPSFRPNQLLAVSLPYPVLNPENFRPVVRKVCEQLLTPHGVRTLAPSDPSYLGQYRGDVVQRDRAYHQGSAYPWLLGPLVTAYLRTHGRSDAALAHARSFLAPCLAHLADHGHLPELFDGSDPYSPGGAIASARSVAELLRAYTEDILNLTPPPARPPTTAPTNDPVPVPT